MITEHYWLDIVDLPVQQLVKVGLHFECCLFFVQFHIRVTRNPQWARWLGKKYFCAPQKLLDISGSICYIPATHITSHIIQANQEHLVQEIFDKIGKPLTLSQEIESKIEDAIRQKKLAPGQKLPSENELCTMFGVSRTALREALRMLSARGLLYVRKGDGIYVNNYSSSQASKPMSLYLELQFDKEYIMHLVHVRQMIEPHIARLAAKNRTEEDLKRIESNLEKFLDRDQDAQRIAQLDVEFHTAIAQASGNPLIPLIMDPLFSMLPKIKTLIVNHLKKVKSDNAPTYHQKIFDMITMQDEQGAFDAMKAHLEIAERDSLLLIQSMKDVG